jgi:hypothetical protein
MENKLKEIAAYVAEHIEDYEMKVHIALNRIDRMRCPLSMADPILYDEIEDAIKDWCDDNEFSYDDWDEDSCVDPEAVLFFTEE